MNVRFYYRSTLNLKYNKENEEFIKETINQINDKDALNIIFENFKSFENIYGSAMIISFIHMCDIEGKNAVIHIDLETRFCNFGDDDEKLKTIKDIVIFFSKLDRKNEGDTTKISYQISKSLGTVENSKYSTNVTQIQVNHILENDNDNEIEAIEFIDHLKSYYDYYRNNKFISKEL